MSSLRHIFIIVLVFAFVLLTPIAVPAQGSCAGGAPSVTAPVGTICGKASTVTIQFAGPYSASAYLGIPYAQPPVGNLRWQNPQPLSALPQNFQATQFGNMCPQPSGPASPGTCPLPANQSEDCLFLNVWTPTSARQGLKLPVMVFVYGGAFVTGTGGSTISDMYDGTYLAATGNAIVVTFNYRLGSLGFLALDGITNKSNNNFGFRDQIMALQWVKNNIASFGGDPGNVTLFGESAGAMSVGLHVLSSSQSAGLFQAAIMESNPLGVAYKTLDEAATLGRNFQSAAGCSTVDCLRKTAACNLVTAETSLKVDPPLQWTSMASVLPWSPEIDGTLITRQPITGARNLDVPMILGTNQAEGVVFVDLAEQKMSDIPIGGLIYNKLLHELFSKADVSLIHSVRAYACGDLSLNCSQQLKQLITDYVFTCANRNLAIQAAKATAAKPVYAFQFTHVPNFNVWQRSGVTECAFRVCHGAEVPFVFNTVELTGSMFQQNEETLSQTVADYWTAFAANQNPNGGNRLSWPNFQTNSTYMILDETPSTPNDPFATSANCTNLWDKIGYQSTKLWSRLLAPAEAAEQ